MAQSSPEKFTNEQLADLYIIAYNLREGPVKDNGAAIQAFMQKYAKPGIEIDKVADIISKKGSNNEKIVASFTQRAQKAVQLIGAEQARQTGQFADKYIAIANMERSDDRTLKREEFWEEFDRAGMNRLDMAKAIAERPRLNGARKANDAIAGEFFIDANQHALAKAGKEQRNRIVAAIPAVPPRPQRPAAAQEMPAWSEKQKQDLANLYVAAYLGGDAAKKTCIENNVKGPLPINEIALKIREIGKGTHGLEGAELSFRERATAQAKVVAAAHGIGDDMSKPQRPLARVKAAPDRREQLNKTVWVQPQGRQGAK